MDIRDKIQALVRSEVLFDEPMKRHTSMGVGGKVDMLLSPANIEELCSVIRYLRSKGIAFLPLGNGSNLIVRDGGFRGALISLRLLQSLRIAKSVNAETLVYAEAGVALKAVVDLALKESLAGMEFCAGIPGTLGGGIRMNAGAYGREMKEITESVCVVSTEGFVKHFSKTEMGFRYRHCCLSVGDVIVSALLRLENGLPAEFIQRQVSDYISIRRQKHPLRFRSAGSIFKNPPDIPAGKVIEELGLKGLQVGGAQVAREHGNFIVNRGDATASDILVLIERIQKEVRKERNILLEPEVMIVGEDL